MPPSAADSASYGILASGVAKILHPQVESGVGCTGIVLWRHVSFVINPARRRRAAGLAPFRRWARQHRQPLRYRISAYTVTLQPRARAGALAGSRARSVRSKFAFVTAFDFARGPCPAEMRSPKRETPRLEPRRRHPAATTTCWPQGAAVRSCPQPIVRAAQAHYKLMMRYVGDRRAVRRELSRLPLLLAEADGIAAFSIFQQTAIDASAGMGFSVLNSPSAIAFHHCRHEHRISWLPRLWWQ